MGKKRKNRKKGMRAKKTKDGSSLAEIGAAGAGGAGGITEEIVNRNNDEEDDGLSTSGVGGGSGRGDNTNINTGNAQSVIDKRKDDYWEYRNGWSKSEKIYVENEDKYYRISTDVNKIDDDTYERLKDVYGHAVNNNYKSKGDNYITKVHYNKFGHLPKGTYREYDLYEESSGRGVRRLLIRLEDDTGFYTGDHYHYYIHFAKQGIIYDKK